MIARIKNSLNRLLINSGIMNAKINPGSRIIMYHGIDTTGNKTFNGRFISVSDFEKQISYFKKKFEIIPLQEFFRNNQGSNSFKIAITFDDGYQNNFKYALPILEKYNVPATIFTTGMNLTGNDILWTDLLDISTKLIEEKLTFEGHLFEKNYLGKLYCKPADISLFNYMKKKGPDFNTQLKLKEHIFNSIGDFRKDSKIADYWKLLSDEEIIKLSKSPLLEIGSHSMYHSFFENTPIELNEYEFVQSKKYFENLIQKEIISFAYPFGSYKKENKNQAEQAGYQNQLAVNFINDNDSEDSRIRDRYGIYPFFSEKELVYKLNKKREN